jgi:Ion channel
MPHIIIELAVATAMVMLTVMIHGGGLALLSRFLRFEAKEEAMHHVPPLSARGLLATLALVLALFALHGLEIWIYALLFYELGAVQGFENAVYFSTITYAAIGYSDEAIADGWRLVGAIEGINGVLLLGWSTAFFITMVARLGRR